MPRPLNLLIAAVVIGSAPVSALAQAWPSTVVAAAPQIAPQPRVPALNLQREPSVLRPATRLTAPSERRALKLNPIGDVDEVPEVELRAKAAWSDDLGLRVGPTRLAYKSRF